MKSALNATIHWIFKHCSLYCKKKKKKNNVILDTSSINVIILLSNILASNTGFTNSGLHPPPRFDSFQMCV